MNKPLQTALWENMQTFAFDDPTSGFPFSKKLQQENNWSDTFTNQAIEEYRKFIFLCCILPNGASPSETVDKVWHLHLTYTTNYWQDFCKNTLHKDIHHHPSKSGSEEAEKHTNWYRQTLDQYRSVFAKEPPATIWPVPAMITQLHPVEIYAPGFFKKTLLLFLLFTVLFVTGFNLFKSSGEDFLVFYFLLMVAGIFVSWILQEHKLKKLQELIEQHFPTQFNRYQIARFLYGPHRAYQTALVDLLKRGIIDTSGQAYKLSPVPSNDSNKEDNPLLPALTQFIDAGEIFTYHEGMIHMANERLRHPAFDFLTSLSKQVDYQKFMIPAIVWVIGFARLFQGMANEKPVGYLVFEIGFFSLIALMVAANYSYTKLVFDKTKNRWMSDNNNGYGNDILNNFTLLGVAAIAGFAEYNELNRVFTQAAPIKGLNADGGVAMAASSCSSGGDSSCGGGAGCGGCGGGD